MRTQRSSNVEVLQIGSVSTTDPRRTSTPTPSATRPRLHPQLRRAQLWNRYLRRADVASLPAPSRNVLRLLFDPALPVRRVLEPDHASWPRLAAFSIVQFRLDNVLWQYQRLVSGPDRQAQRLA